MNKNEPFTSSENDRRLKFLQRQFEITALRALHAYGQAVTGVSTLRKLSHGREPTDEERTQGHVLGWTELSDKEKIQESFETMQRHIHFLDELNEAIDKILSE